MDIQINISMVPAEGTVTVTIPDPQERLDLQRTLDVEAVLISLQDAVSALENGNSFEAQGALAEALARVSLHRTDPE